MYSYFTYETDLCKLTFVERDGFITNISFCENEFVDAELKETDLIKDSYIQVVEYLDGKRKNFEMKTKLYGTEFQMKVWNALLEIPYGETSSYKDIAIRVGNEKASRAVGMANNKNPIAIVVPCHRVIGASGKLVGYASGLENKMKLLKLEKER